MALENGHYAPVVAKKVTHWPSPDRDGNGEQVWRDEIDADGNNLGRSAAKDKDGNEIYHYEAPEGFRNMPSFDGTPNYVKVDERGRVWRHPVTGEALSIKPGRTLVEHSNGDFQYLDDDYSRYLFEKSHEPTDAPKDTAPVERRKTAKEAAAEKDAEDKAAFEAWKADQAKKGTQEQEVGE